MIPVLTKQRGVAAAAMTLAFVGAVEQNLLHFPTLPLRSLEANHLMSLGMLFEYLDGVYKHGTSEETD